MRSERQFIAPMDAQEASQRAQYILGKWRYKCWAIPGGVRFERSFALAGLVVIHPHHVHSRIDVHFKENEDGSCHVHLAQQVFKYGQPCSNLDKIVWQGDIEDLEANLIRREEPQIDRVRQNAYAGTVSIKYILVGVVPPLVASIWLLLANQFVAAALCLLVIVAAAIVMPYLPFQMPHFPLNNQVPTAPFTSNYPRTRH